MEPTMDQSYSWVLSWQEKEMIEKEGYTFMNMTHLS